MFSMMIIIILLISIVLVEFYIKLNFITLIIFAAIIRTHHIIISIYVCTSL